MGELLRETIFPLLGEDILLDVEDAAVLALPVNRIALTTDSFVVKPLFFPGGDIGKLAVCGTVNDLAMVGARPRLPYTRPDPRGGAFHKRAGEGRVLGRALG